MEQGNGVGLIIRDVISILLYGILHDKDYGIKMKAPLSKLAPNTAACGLVDDTDTIQIELEEDVY